MAEPCIPVKRDHLCCRLCHEVLRVPTTIPCGHNFCLLCIQKYWGHGSRNDETWRCPECDHTFHSRPPLIKNTTLADLVEDLLMSEASAGHDREHPQPRKRPKTSSITLGASGGNMCSQHNIPLDVYCCSDGQCVCPACAFIEHTGHKTEPVSVARWRKQEELGKIKEQRLQTLQIGRKERRNLKNNLKQIEGGARAAEEYCEGIIAKLIDCLQRHYSTVRELIGAQERMAAAVVQSSLQELERKLAEHISRENEFDQLSQTDDDIHFLQKWSSLMSLCDTHEAPSVSENPLPPFEPIKKAVQLFGRQLEAFCDKGINAISQTVGTHTGPRVSTHTGPTVSTHTGPTSDPKTREEFLEYACELTLDPDTAHRVLVISAGDKEVTLNPQNQRDPVLHHAERFSYRHQVLCKEGLQAERCYYEVELHGEKAEIALAYKGMDRKSRTILSAFGGNNKSWSLDCSKTYSVSHKGDSIQLTATPSQRRIGVYLEFKKGLLTFYEVSGNMTFLYRIVTTFAEPLYPGFWLGEKCCIRLL